MMAELECIWCQLSRSQHLLTSTSRGVHRVVSCAFGLILHTPHLSTHSPALSFLTCSSPNLACQNVLSSDTRATTVRLCFPVPGTICSRCMLIHSPTLENVVLPVKPAIPICGTTTLVPSLGSSPISIPIGGVGGAYPHTTYLRTTPTHTSSSYSLVREHDLSPKSP